MNIFEFHKYILVSFICCLVVCSAGFAGCPSADLNSDCKVDYKDLAILSRQWLNQQENTVSDHVNEIEICTEWDYQAPGVEDDSYVIGVELETDFDVSMVEFTTPAGHTFEIPCIDLTWYAIEGGYMEIGVEDFDESGYRSWIYCPEYDSPNYLTDYGDGEYNFTIHYNDGGSHQTSVWFGVPDTNEPIPQPTQQPVITSFGHGSTVSSPVQLTWQACTDTAAENIWLCVIGHQDETEWIFPTDAVGLGYPLSLYSGQYEVELGFEVWYDCINNDGVDVEIGKYSECYYDFTVSNIE